MREKLSLPIGIREPSGSAKAPPAARSDNVLRKMRRAAHTDQGRTARRGRCAAGGENQPTGIARKKGAEPPPPCRNSLLALPCPASRLHRPAPTPKGACADLPAGRAVVPFPCVAPSSPHADPAKEARADLPAGRAVVPALRRAFIAPCRSRQRGSRRPSHGAGGRSRLPRRARAHKKNGAEAPFFCCLFTPWNR